MRAEEQAKLVSEYVIRRTPLYREMKEKLQAEVARLNKEARGSRAEVCASLTVHELQQSSIYQHLRHAHKEIAAKNRELQSQLRAVMPTRRHTVERSVQYRALREAFLDFQDEVRDARREVRKARWQLEQLDAMQAQLHGAQRLIADFPATSGTPFDLAQWHFRQAALWLAVAEFPLTTINWWVKAARNDGSDPTQSAREKNPIPSSTRRELLACSSSCAYCQSEEDLTIDHITPLAAGGKSTRGNLQVLCRRCNSRKHTKSDNEARATAIGPAA